MVQRRLRELENECKALGLQVSPSKKKISRRDYILALRGYFLRQKYPDGKIPKYLKDVMDLESFMLCARYDDQTPELQDKLWDSTDYIVQEKINGVRMLITYSSQEGIHFFSRNISVTDYSPVEYKNIDLPGVDFSGLVGVVDSFIIDTEVLCPEAKVNTAVSHLSSGGVTTETNLAATSAILALNDEDSLRLQRENNISLQFRAFHLLELNGSDYKNTPFSMMDDVLKALVERLSVAGLNVVKVPTIWAGKRGLFESILAYGGEGVVFKHVDSVYIPTESRSHRQWIKYKRTVSSSISDTVDGWISGFMPGGLDTGNENLIGSLKVSIFLQDGDKEVEHEVARVSNLTLEQRKEMTTFDDFGKPVLKPEFYNKVVEIDGQWVSARNRRFMHAKLVRIREDKSKDDCSFQKHVLEKMII